MLALLLAGSLLQSPTPIERDAYGVPHIYASTWDDAFYFAGYAVAEDRLWQMEQSRRMARGRMAEVFGKSFEAADRDVLRFGYTDAEVQLQFDGLTPRVKGAFAAYARGVNAYIADAKAKAQLPEGYAQNGFEPEPWTVADSSAIAIRMFQMFGRRDPGELQNLALSLYLQSQPAKDRWLDVLDDFVWQNDPSSPTTVSPAEDPLGENGARFPRPSRQATEAHFAKLPKVGLMELLPALRMAMNESPTLYADSGSAQLRAASYAVVVGPNRSATGAPILLSAPQMGFTAPAIIHEISIVGPGISAAGLDVPGIPGVQIGHTQHVAWGLTSGVADTDDYFFFAKQGDDGYRFRDETRRLNVVKRTLKVKGQADQVVERKETLWGPVILESRGASALFARRSASYKTELRSLEVCFSMYDARTAADLERAFPAATVNFNVFFACTNGDFGWRYLGFVPDRSDGIDPRFPAPGSPEYGWKGYVPFAKMPHVTNPKSGLIVNWNNKPAAWWPNGDAPVWGRVGRVEALQKATDKPKLSVTDVELAAWTIARVDPGPALAAGSWPHLGPLIRKSLEQGEWTGVEADAARYLRAYDGLAIEGSQGATLYQSLIASLREEIFLPTTGNFVSPNVFAMAASPSVIHDALEGKTKVDYLKGKPAGDVIRAAFKAAVGKLQTARGNDPGTWGFAPGGIPVPGQAPIPYSNRGSYIQIVEVRNRPRGRNVLPPGVAERGEHAFDQVPLSRAWTYKPMRMRPFEGR